MSHTWINHAHLVGGGHRRGLLAGRVVVALTILAAMLGLSGASASADGCANAALRAQNNSTGLPDCRAYELVSSSFKEGFAPYNDSYTDDGRFSYTSTGNFADNGMGSALGNQYVAMRSSTGWTTASPAPSGPTYTSPRGLAEIVSADLRSSIWQMRRSEDPANVLSFYVRDPERAFTRIGPAANPATLPPEPPGPAYDGGPALAQVAGASADLSHYLFTIAPSLGYPGDAAGGVSSLYEYVGTGNARPRLVGVDNTGHQISLGDTCASGSGISGDGRVVFFDPGCLGGTSQVWVRINGVTSIEASASECTRSSGDPGGSCSSSGAANFVGAARDGSRVFFTTSQQLVNGDTDTTNDLYACDIPPGTPAPVGAVNPCAALREVSGARSGAGVESVAAVSQDGARVYFVAQGILADNIGANDLAAVAGDHNLYMWQQDAEHPTGDTTFVGKLDTNDTGAPNAQISANGRYLVLSTTTALVDSGPAADIDAAADAYRYDTETRAMVRLSTATSGDGGNEAGFDTTLSMNKGSAVSADGDTVVFLSNEALSPDDINNGTDVYDWHQGRVSLISSGQPSLPTTSIPFAWITASGSDIFFTSTEQLTPADGDTTPDIYDARIGGGFDFPAPRACAGEDCQGPPKAAPDLPAARSDVLPGPDNPVPAAPAFSLRAVSAAQRKRLATTGRVTLTVTANTPGIVSATAAATIVGRSVRVGSARQTMPRAGTARLVLVLSKKARKRLAAVGVLTVKVVIADSKVATTRSATLELIHPRASVRGRS
jgi:hypothetical protein